MSFNRPPARSASSPASRRPPEIWAEGSQSPRFDLGAFARVGLQLSRHSARVVLLGAGRLLSSAAEIIAENALGPQFAHASRLGRLLPSRAGVAGGLRAIGELTTAAADVAEPTVEMPVVPQDPPPPPMLLSRKERLAASAPAPKAPPPGPVAATTGNAASEFDAPTLAAIRALIDEMRATAEAGPAAKRPARDALPPPSGRALLTQGIPLSPPEPRRPTPGERLLATSYRLATGLVAAATTLLVLPVGLIRAGLAHLHGDDLRRWP